MSTAPANTAVEYEEIVFHDMPGEWSPYFGKPTYEKDELWDQLYTGKVFAHNPAPVMATLT